MKPLRAPVLLGFAALLCTPAPAAAQWDVRGEGTEVEAGSTVDGTFAGLAFRCEAQGRLSLVLTHNGTSFDRDRAHTVVLSVDGMARMVEARAVAGDRAGDDDLVHTAAAASLEPLLAALARGRTLEVSAPSGRYALGLQGSARAIAALRERCPSLR